MYVYPRPFTAKPKKSDIEAINRDLYLNYSNNYYDWTVEEIAYLLGNGHTICPSALSENRRIKSNWMSQQLFLLDFDKYDVPSCKEISESINIWPSFGYYTFSHTEQKPKFRLAFWFDHKITDILTRDLIMKSLYKVFNKKADSQCVSDYVRIFFPGQEMFDSKYEIVSDASDFEIPSLDFDMFSKIEKFILDRDKKNYKRNIERFYAGTDIILDSIKGSYPPSVWIQKIYRTGFDEFQDVLINQYPMSVKAFYPKKQKVEDQSGVDNNISLLCSPSKSSTIEKYIWTLLFDTDTKTNKTTTHLKKFSQSDNKLEKKDECKLLTEALNNGYHLSTGHKLKFESRMHLTTNLRHIRGGQKLLGQIINKIEHPDHSQNYIIEQAKGQLRSMEHPTNCNQSRCPFFDQCQRKGKNIIHQISKSSIPPNKFENEKLIELSEAEALLAKAFDSSESKIIKAETALGKTETYINSIKEHNTVILVPTNQLATEIVDRLQNVGIDTERLESLYERLSPESQQKYRQLRALGFDEAYRIIKKSCSHDDLTIIDNYGKYFTAMLHKQVLVTTHSRFLNSNKVLLDNFQQIIIDEDIIDYIFCSGRVSVDDILQIASATDNKTIKQQLETFVSSLDDKGYYAVEGLPSAKKLTVALDLDGVFESFGASELNGYRFKTNITEWLNANKIFFDGDNFHYAYLNIPNFGSNFKICSATVDEFIWSKIFPDVKFEVIDKAKPKGKIIQHYETDYSRESLKQIVSNGKLKDEFKDVHDKKMNVITFKTFVDDFKRAGFNVIAHFGATAGLDAFKGQDLAVIGTYRENPFGIVTKANAIGLDFTFADLQYRSKKYVKRNGWQFPLYSFDNEDLLDLDCWLIEKEILQAAGRARHLRFDCDVHVYTNFMI